MPPSHRDRTAVAALLLGCGLLSVAAAPMAYADDAPASPSSPAVSPDGDGASAYGPTADPWLVDDDPLPIRGATHPAGNSAPGDPAGSPAGPAATRVPAAAAAYVLPVHGYHLSARFGERGSHWGSSRHTGLDFVVPSGTPVHAVAAGRVTAAGWDGPYGRSVTIAHADGTSTRYAHLSSIRVAVGDRLPVGEVLGRSGSSGNTTGAHLHLETVVGGSPTDPARWLRSHGVRA